MRSAGFTESECRASQRHGQGIRSTPRGAMMSAERVVEMTLSANQRGDVICIPGVHNKIAAGLLNIFLTS